MKLVVHQKSAANTDGVTIERIEPFTGGAVADMLAGGIDPRLLQLRDGREKQLILTVTLGIANSLCVGELRKGAAKVQMLLVLLVFFNPTRRSCPGWIPMRCSPVSIFN